MGANNHPTTDVETNDTEIRATRLARDLRACDDVKEVTVNNKRSIYVSFELTEPHERTGFPSSVMAILSQYEADLSGGCLEGTVWSGSLGWTANVS
jgi:hypothetical protein